MSARSFRHTSLPGRVVFERGGVAANLAHEVGRLGLQRVLVIATGVIAMLAFIHHPGRPGQGIYAGAIGISALTGAGFALRQLWLQSLPEDLVPTCGPPADYLFDVFSFGEALPMLLKGDGNCAQVQWTLLNLSIPAWTLMAFAGLALLSLWQLLRKT